MIVGIDIGGSTTDAVILENGGIHVVTIEANDPVRRGRGALGKLVFDFGIEPRDIDRVAATGAGCPRARRVAAPKAGGQG